MKFSGTTYQDNAIRFGNEPHPHLATLLFDNLLVKLTNETLDRTASQISAFAIPVTPEESDQALTVTVTLVGFVSLDKGVRATLCISSGERAALIELPTGMLIEQPPMDGAGQAPIDENRDRFAFERQFTATLPVGVEDVLVTLFLLVERIQKNTTAFGQLQIDHLWLTVQSTNVTSPDAAQV